MGTQPSIHTTSRPSSAPCQRLLWLLSRGKRHLSRCGYAIIVCLIGLSAEAETVDQVLVEGSGFTRESAVKYTGEIAVYQVMERYVRANALEAHREKIKYRILDQSSGYLKSLKITKSYLNDEGLHQITAQVRVSVDKLLTSLRNLDVDVKMWAPGPDQAIEGRRGAGRRTGRDRFKDSAGE